MRKFVSFLMMAGLVLTLAGSASAYTSARYMWLEDYWCMREFDENTAQTNTIDAEAPGNAKTAAAFKTAVESAWDAGLGGVLTFDRAAGYDPSGIGAPFFAGKYPTPYPWTVGPSPTYLPERHCLNGGSSGRSGNLIRESTPTTTYPVVIHYDPAYAKSFSLYNPGTAVAGEYMETWPGNFGTPISGPCWVYGANVTDPLSQNNSGGSMGPRGGSTNNIGSLRWDNGANIDAGIVEIGFVALGNGAIWTVTATLSDSSTVVRQFTIGAGSAGDTFVYFAAPSGKTITGLRWQCTTAAGGIVTRPHIDDLGFIMKSAEPMAEPAALGLVGIALLALRKRRS